MTWRIRHSIAKRRGRAMVASILAVLFLVLAPTAGAAIVSGINSKLPQVSLLELDDQIDERDIIFGDARNGTTITWNGVNYTTDVYIVYLGFTDINGTPRYVPQPYSVTSDGKIFFIGDYGGYTPSASTDYQVVLKTMVSTTEIRRHAVSKMRVYLETGQTFPVRIRAIVSGLNNGEIANYFDTNADYLNVSANGTWFEFNISELTRMSVESTIGSQPHLFEVYYVMSTTVNAGDGIVVDLEMYGPESGGVAKNWLNYYFLLGGLVGLVGAVFATPYVNIRSFRKAKHSHTKQFRKNKRKRRFRRRRRRLL